MDTWNDTVASRFPDADDLMIAIERSEQEFILDPFPGDPSFEERVLGGPEAEEITVLTCGCGVEYSLGEEVADERLFSECPACVKFGGG